MLPSAKMRVETPENETQESPVITTVVLVFSLMVILAIVMQRN
jgi:hypothetical protein